MVVGEWAWPWSQQVFMVDASLYGFSIERSYWSYGDVSNVGPVKERRRYKLGAEKDQIQCPSYRRFRFR